MAGSLQNKTVSASLWTLFGFGLGQAIRLASNLLLARLLNPEAFGLIALCLVFLQGLVMLSDTGVERSIIQNPQGRETRFQNTAWSVQVIRGVLLWGLCALGALPVAKFYDEPMLAVLLPALGVSLVLNGFNATTLAVLSRELALQKLIALELLRQTASSVVMIVFAILHPTVLALLAGTLVSHFLNMLLSHFLIRGHRNRFAWDRDALRSILGFGKWIFVSTMLTFLASQSDRLLIGKLTSIQELGVYQIAMMFATLPMEVVMKLGSSVLFPAFSMANANGQNLAAALQRVQRTLCTIGGVAIAGLMACGPALIELLYDERYHAAGWMLQLVAVMAWLRILRIPVESSLLALGHPQWSAGANAAKLVGIFICVPFGFVQGGFRGLLLGFCAAELLGFAVCTVGSFQRQLHVLRLEFVYTAGIAVSAGAGIATSRYLMAHGAETGASFGVTAGVTALFWAQPLWKAVHALRKAQREA